MNNKRKNILEKVLFLNTSISSSVNMYLAE